MRISEFLANKLISYGVRRYYVLPGGFSQNLNDAFYHSALETVFALHESGAGFMACGESKYTGELAICLVTSGPGSTNLITSVASAWNDSIPLLVISGEAKLDLIKLRTNLGLRAGGPQDVDIIRISRPIVKWNAIIESSKSAEYILDKAINIAMADRRGPVWIAVPLDVAGGNYVEN